MPGAYIRRASRIPVNRVEYMDRVNARGVAFLADTGPAGWDPHTVWRERVHGPRGPRRGGDAPAISLADTSAGWDPTETWRLRVQRPRSSVR